MKLNLKSGSVYLNTGGVPWQDDKPWLCLVHGASLDHSVWVLYTRYFARQGYNVLAPDLPGHGHSEGSVPDSIEAMAEWLDGLFDEIGIAPGSTTNSASDSPSLSLAGHSMGSLVALHTASLNPQRFSNLLLLGTAVPMAVGEALLNAAKDNHHAAVDMVSIFGHSFQSRLGGNPVAGINILGAGMRLLESAGPGVMYTGLNACNNYQAGLQAAAQVQARSTLILGENDMMTRPSGAKKLAQTLSAETLLLPGSGHMMLAEQPESTLQAMLKALAD